jgi:hypothetical protein
VDKQTVRRARRWAAVAALLAAAVLATPLVWRGHDGTFVTLGNWTGGILGGLGFIVAVLAIWLTAYLASPQKEEINRLEAARARAAEALELVAVTTQVALSAPDFHLEDDPATLWTIRQTAEHALGVLQASSRDGLYRLAAHLDGPRSDPFSADPSAATGRDSAVLQLMVVQGRLAAIVHGHMDLSGEDLTSLRNMTVRLYREFGPASAAVSAAASGAHIPISQSLLDSVHG